MKTTVLTLAVVAGVAWLAPDLPAAAQAPPSDVYIYSRYFHCDQRIVGDADDAVDQMYKGELDKLVQEKVVSSWGWLVKTTGGEWSRAGYLTAPSLNAVLQAADKLSIRSDWHMGVRVFVTACSSSEDYIWHVVAGNNDAGRRGQFALSTYYVCDLSRGADVDTLVKRDFASKFDKLVAAGKLTSWDWAEQALGGKYQRLATMSAPTRDALITAREEVAHDKALRAACSSHQDYIWEVKDQGH
jgi:hypothetical protein